MTDGWSKKLTMIIFTTAQRGAQMEDNTLLYMPCWRHDMPLSRCGCNGYDEAVDPFWNSKTLAPTELPKLEDEGTEANEG